MRKIYQYIIAALSGVAVGAIVYNHIYSSDDLNQNEEDDENDEHFEDHFDEDLPYYEGNNEEEEEEEEEAWEENFDELALDFNQEQFGIFIVRKDLRMGRGKICAQCGHAALCLYLKSCKKSKRLSEIWFDKFPKVFYFCNDEKSLNDLTDIAAGGNHFVEVVHDAGRTQIAKGTATVLAIGPATKDQIDELTAGCTPIR